MRADAREVVVSVESLELGRFLRARRGQVQPEDVGLPRGDARRVVGLRREEVARLANISPEYYLRLEQGRDHQPSPQVVRAMGSALLLDEYATDYLARLASGGAATGEAVDAAAPDSDPTLDSLLTEWTATPAVIIDRNHSVLAANALGRTVLGGVAGTNLLVDAFLQPPADRAAAWNDYARALVASFRYRGNPRDPAYQRLVGHLSVVDARFRQLWALYEARPWVRGTAHRSIGGRSTVPLTMRHFDVPGRDGRVLVTMHADGNAVAASALSQLLVTAA
jgi:transcriptional regulator with XRE-family HTH domain